MKAFRALAASALATAAATIGVAAPAQADPRVFSAKVTVDNQTSERLDLVSQEATEGIIDVYANETIKAGSSDWMRTKADVDQGGTAGSIKYDLENGGKIVIYFSNPYEEDNEYSCFVPEGLTCDWDDNGLYETEVTFTITED
ncbi:hypothetical protein Q0Z83_055040 [Actinoplanes sichuanensis]|uniref:Uncharacterized protein n=1 Tax=Actinoplanes sichuanensis TaxID=512349 RepID=A0ABW4AS89_9ACTN|nr:hypothetical protein [Actinoplanes sichuanensis]BEL07313.1 hypothetical protein Q0Z83_055040 [Actinoplanes sichuanensis]